MKEWNTGTYGTCGTYEINHILAKILEVQQQGKDVTVIPWLLHIKRLSVASAIDRILEASEIPKQKRDEITKITSSASFCVFKDADIAEDCCALKFDVLVTQNGKTLALKKLGKGRDNGDMYYLISWISEYDPKNESPCSGMIFLFDPAAEGTIEIVAE